MGIQNWFRIKAQKPTDKGMKRFIGKTLIITIGQPAPTPVVVESIVGNLTHKSRFEVNGEYLIVILDAFKQLEKDDSITQEQIQAFDEIVCESVVSNAAREKDLLSMLPPLPKFNPEEAEDGQTPQGTEPAH